MDVTRINDVQDQVQKFWAPMFMKELRESLLLGSLINKEYQGDLKAMGDTVKVSQIAAPSGSTLTVGTDADTFSTEQLTMTQVEVKADKRFVAAYEFHDLAFLQSQLDAQDSEIRSSLLFAMQKQVNNYLYGLVAPSTSAPDHTVTGVTDFNAAQVAAVRYLAAKAKWVKDKPFWILASPQYYSDMLDDAILANSDYTNAVDSPVVSGQIVRQRFGFNILEDNSDGINSLSSDDDDQALIFHPDFLLFVMQREPQIQISSLHSQKKFGFVMSIDMVGGAKLGIDGAKKHITVVNNV